MDLCDFEEQAGELTKLVELNVACSARLRQEIVQVAYTKACTIAAICQGRTHDDCVMLFKRMCAASNIIK